MHRALIFILKCELIDFVREYQFELSQHFGYAMCSTKNGHAFFNTGGIEHLKRHCERTKIETCVFDKIGKARHLFCMCGPLEIELEPISLRGP